MRIEPRHPPPPVNFLEWDGLIRTCFSRKNKTLGAVFRQPTALGLLHQNYETLKALSEAQQHQNDGAAAAFPSAAYKPFQNQGLVSAQMLAAHNDANAMAAAMDTGDAPGEGGDDSSDDMDADAVSEAPTSVSGKVRVRALVNFVHVAALFQHSAFACCATVGAWPCCKAWT